ncbi:hypothetical protein TK0590 [Thermococcus kodakarensis KOD1]|uniref:Uncharacterized protein n=1 Tax=Thermococcus kodakarensis (strain ATCC BAA-918 / JCM 12380 / KOD1) TaxID=69014 RepID=Q5JFC4_THEKO|nr:hypothetical protein [Thermococcus kodakarensis]WCN28637.1 hypothetical protein POG15_03030 [Thermococcus kodakarensis]WCN30935.1 hypothetical protein POG21_03030 [Thermococcus kodakarensis]BAD84779.1 hypothetical protein TK0590 [Thermococcus kodakarensis KOD1]
MYSIKELQDIVSRIVSTKGHVGITDGGIEIHIHGGISGQEFREIENAAWKGGLVLDRIYYHRISDTLAIRFKKPGD